MQDKKLNDYELLIDDEHNGNQKTNGVDHRINFRYR